VATSATASTIPRLVDLQAQLQALLDGVLTPGPPDWQYPGEAANPPTGAILGVRVPGQPDLVLTTGINGLAGSAPLDAQGRFLTGAVSARFTTVVAMRLIEVSLLDADAPLSRWLADYPAADRITVGMLLDGTSGMPGLDAVAQAAVIPDPTRVWTLPEVLAEAAKFPATGEPGTAPIAGYGMSTIALAVIIEAVTGASLSENIARYITTPLHLNDTALDKPGPRPAGLQDGLLVLNNTVTAASSLPSSAFLSFGAPTSAMMSSARDLLTFNEAIAHATLLRRDTTAGVAYTADRLSGGVYVGRGAINGYCPCDTSTNPVTVRGIGMRGSENAEGSFTQVLTMPDGISVILHVDAAPTDDSAPVLIALREAVYTLVSGK
jgi:CubicO group peptidase (beta-lactamase class C family)